MADFFLGNDGVQTGPHPEHELLSRGLRHDSLIWREGMPAWIRADQLAEMGQYLATIPLPSQPGTQSHPSYPHGVATNTAPNAPFAYGPDGVPINQTQFGNGNPNQQPSSVSYLPYANVPVYNPHTSNRIAAGLTAIFFGYFGVHKFLMGSTGAGLTMMLISILSCFTLWPLMALIAIIEGIIYLCKTEEQFFQDYVLNKRSWF